MTMRITIKNEDTARTALVRQVEFNPNVDPAIRSESTVGLNEIAPGASLDVWLHSGRRVVVDEKPQSMSMPAVKP